MTSPTVFKISRHYAGVILKDKKGRMLLQQRDSKPSIVNSGLISFFGGSCNPDESAIECALREIFEELNIHLNPQYLQKLAEYVKQEKDGTYTHVTLFVYTQPVKVHKTDVTEGKLYLFDPKSKELSDLNCTSICRRGIEEYLRRH